MPESLNQSITDEAPAGQSSQTYVLVHGGYHGAWCWKTVANRLRASGHTVYTPTLTGLGERSHLLHANPSLETFIQDVAQVLHYEELSDVILVGHSFAGSVVSALADRVPERLRHLVYLDAQLLQSGQAPADTAPPEAIEVYKQRAMATGGVSIPPGPPENFGISDPQMIEWVKKLLTPHPYRTYFDKLSLEHPLGNGKPVTYIACTKPYFANIASSREYAKAQDGWRYLEIATGHDAMLTEPEELTRMLEDIS
ncbi:alpha/beta hydrolase [Paraburkholderia sp. JHI869]|uniref:alpha/beta fold hydrolase n=1 Tax=Paraburkholderia sp. JHI869 TaxID=3112959 RepID=UPI00317A7EA9